MPTCGTEAAFQRHQDLGMPACARCWDAHEVALANRRERNRRRPGRPVNPLQYRLALRGQEPAEALAGPDRELLVRTLVGWGWPDRRIAELADGREVLVTLALPLPLGDVGPLMAAIGECAEQLGYVDVVYDAVRGGIVARREPAGGAR